MKILIILMIALTLCIPGIKLSSQETQKKIVESVSVDWWLVPVFFLDKDGNPVEDIKESDIDVMINGKKIDNYILNRRSLVVTQTQEAQKQESELPSPKNQNVVFLLFDNAMASESFVLKTKVLAERIIFDSPKGTRFVCLSVDAFSGLIYAGEIINDKVRFPVIDLKKLHPAHNSRELDYENFINMDALSETKGLDQNISSKVSIQITDSKAQEITDSGESESEIMRGIKAQVAQYYQRKMIGLVRSFQSLSLYLTSFQEKKIVYFFSEGIPLTIRKAIPGSLSMFRSIFDDIGKELARSGATLFIINPYDTSKDPNAETSGDQSLRLLAQQSGAKYLDGVKGDVVKQISSINRGYYEISFPGLPDSGGGTKELEVKSKRKDISVISMRFLEKRKKYMEMNPTEREILALNVIQGNQGITDRVKIFDAVVDSADEGKDKARFTIHIPGSFLKKNIDIYKFWVKDKLDIVSLEKETIIPQKNRMEILFKNPPADALKNLEEGTGELKAYFVYFNGEAEEARVHGLVLFDEDPEITEEAETLAQTINEKDKSEKKGKISENELKEILKGAAQYCEKLKNSAFHFYCVEDIAETKIPLTAAEDEQADISLEDMKKGTVRALDSIRNTPFTNVKKYVFGYRLIKTGKDIKEERQFISSRDKVPVERHVVIEPTAFFSEKAIFAPVTLLDKERQSLYNYSFIRHEKWNGKQVIVIEAKPKVAEEIFTVYGEVWIDPTDYSIVKIAANPQSIKGYDKLKELARKLHTKLYFTLETEFNEFHNGIRFPTQVNMLEKYKGGEYINQYRGHQGWERTRTVFLYKDYQFFAVETSVSVENN